MPGITLTISGQQSPEALRNIVSEVIALTSHHLEKDPERTMVIVRHVAEDEWYIAGKSLTEHGKRSFRVEVTVTDETTTKSQKANYQKAVFERLSALIGNAHPHSNVHVIDCRASAYSYGGVTQEYRYQHAN